MEHSKSSAMEKRRRKSRQEIAVYLARTHPDYWDEEMNFFLRCLAARSPGRADKRAAAFYKALQAFHQTGDAALSEFLRLGGWDELIGAVLDIQAKLPIHPRAFQIADALAGLRHRAQGPKDSGRDAAVK